MALGLIQPVTEKRPRYLPAEFKLEQQLRLIASPPSVSRLSRKCEILKVSESYVFMLHR
jgi:hypothetical protein